MDETGMQAYFLAQPESGQNCALIDAHAGKVTDGSTIVFMARLLA